MLLSFNIVLCDTNLSWPRQVERWHADIIPVGSQVESERNNERQFMSFCPGSEWSFDSYIRRNEE